MKECERVECMGSNGCIDKCWKPKGEWINLTDEEIRKEFHPLHQTGVEFARAIEAKLKEKNT